jgi:hypothetical protein
MAYDPEYEHGAAGTGTCFASGCARCSTLFLGREVLKWLFSILYGLLVIWTGLQRGVESAAFKPNALFFCLVTGIAAIAAGFLFRLEKRLAGWITALVTTLIVLAFYFTCFVGQPEKDATYRVAIAILASIAHLVVLFLPPARSRETTQSSGVEGE